MRSPIKWHGGKSYLAKRLIKRFPPHRIYLEPFGGGASIILNKTPCDVETYNDLNGSLTNFFRVLRDDSEEFQRLLALVPYSEIEFNLARDQAEICLRLLEHPVGPNGKVLATDTDRAFMDFIRWRQSFGGQGKSWSATTTRARGGIADCVNAWWTAIEGLPEVIARLQQVQISNRTAVDAIKKWDHPEAFIYCDPPYVHASRVTKDAYDYEMADDDHRELAKVLNSIKGKAMVSGYPSPLYDEIFKGWQTAWFTMANHAAGGTSKARKVETIWMNY